MDREALMALAERAEKATGPDRALSEKAHEALGWRERLVTRLGLSGRTKGSYMWFTPADGWRKPRRNLPCLSGPLVRKRVAAALRAHAATNEGSAS